MNEKNYFGLVIGFVVIAFILGGAIGGIAVYGYLRPHRPVDRQSEAAIGINREITDGLRERQEDDRRNIAALEEIRRRHEETDSTIRELGQLNNGSGDLLQILRKRIEILEDYYRDTGGIIGSVNNSCE